METIVKLKDTLGKEFDAHPDDRISIFGLYKIYKRDNVEVVALRGLNISVKRGEFVMIIGPSGCGKTSLLNLISGIDKPSAGKLFVDHVDITALSTDELTMFRREKIGFVFQFLNLIRSFTARENVELPLMPLSVPGEEMTKRIDDLLGVVNMKDRQEHYPSEMSGGEQQRIAVATALVNKPSILLADEPTGELDSKNAHDLMGVFKSLQKTFPDISIIMVTHDLSLTQYADRIVKMKDGMVDESLSLQYNKGGKDNLQFSAGDGKVMIDGHAQSCANDFNMVGKVLKDALPEYKLLSEIKSCSKCKSQNLQISIIATKKVEKPHPLFQLLPIMVICSDCQHAERMQVKILNM
jgi:putative ABC transport system ATP-binding protein